MSVINQTREDDARKELQDIFNAIDTDNNGVIDNTELRNVMRVIFSGADDMKLTKEEIDEMISEVDGDKDGRMTFDGKKFSMSINSKSMFVLFRICQHLCGTCVTIYDVEVFDRW